MVTQQHLTLLREGLHTWNEWRRDHPRAKPNLSEVDLANEELIDANLDRTNLSGADLSEADLSGASLVEADLSGTNLTEANLAGATLYRANLAGADLTDAFLRWADLSRADLSGATLAGADLRRTHLSKTILRNADLSGSKVYGIAAWNLELGGARQSDLVITEVDEPTITVDDIEVAQFVYLLIKNANVRRVIDTITSKAVLILGRFSPERKRVLDTLRIELRKKDLLPIVFDFDRPADRNLTETVSTLAHLARFVVADITDAKSIAQELMRIIPSLPSLPVQPLLVETAEDYAMFRDFLDYPWVLPPFRYKDTSHLVDSLDTHVIQPCESRSRQIEKRRRGLEEQLKRTSSD